jgi:flagellar motor switch/type III secretory pathway protein FliN
MSAATASALAEENVMGQADPDARWASVQSLPCRFTAEIALPHFRVRDFLALHAGSIVGTQWGLERDIPLQVNGIFIGWGELEGAGARLAVRVTELA